jgi:hypothetical protein
MFLIVIREMMSCSKKTETMVVIFGKNLEHGLRPVRRLSGTRGAFRKSTAGVSDFFVVTISPLCCR